MLREMFYLCRAAASSLTLDALNAQLSAMGLPSAVITSAPVVILPTGQTFSDGSTLQPLFSLHWCAVFIAAAISMQ